MDAGDIKIICSHDNYFWPLGYRLFDQHRQPLDPGSPTNPRRRATTQALDQPVITPPREHRPLRAQPVGHKLECGMPVIIQSAHQPTVARPRDARRVQPVGHRLEERRRFLGQIGIDIRRAVGDRPVARVFRIENPQRVLLQPRKAILRQLLTMRLEMRDQRLTPGIARRRIAQCVELERHALADPQLAQQLVGEHQQLHVRLRLRRADDLGVDLVKLAIPPLLRAFVAEHRAVRRDLHRRVLLPAFGDERARDSRGKFRAQRQQVAAAIGKGVHLLRHHIRRFAHRPREHLGRLEHRQLDPPEAIEFPHAVERVDDMAKPALVLERDILRAAHAFGGLYPRHSAGLICKISPQRQYFARSGNLRRPGRFANRVHPVSGYSTMVVQQPSKLNTRVRFPLPAPTFPPAAS